MFRVSEGKGLLFLICFPVDVRTENGNVIFPLVPMISQVSVV